MFHNRAGLVGLMAIDNPYPYNPLIDGLDLLLLAVMEGDDPDPVRGACRLWRQTRSDPVGRAVRIGAMDRRQ